MRPIKYRCGSADRENTQNWTEGKDCWMDCYPGKWVNAKTELCTHAMGFNLLMLLTNVGKNARGKNVIGKNVRGKIARGKNVRAKVVKIQ